MNERLKLKTKELGSAINNVTGAKPYEKRFEEVVDRYSFKRVAKRNPGEEDKHSFLRKGIAGDWKNVFSKEARELFNYYAGKEWVMKKMRLGCIEMNCKQWEHVMWMFLTKGNKWRISRQ